MVRIRVELDAMGCLRSLRATGHAGAGLAGADPVCAAVSALVRSTARLLYGTEGLEVDGQAPGPGRLELVVIGCTPQRRQWLRGVTDVLFFGLRDLHAEHPESVRLEIGETGIQEH